MILKLALTIILLYLCCFGILQRFFCVKLIFVSFLHEGWSISSKTYLLLALPHLWLTVLKLFRTKVHFFPDQDMEYNGFFRVRVLNPYSKVLCRRGDHLNMCCFPNLCFYALFYPLSCNNFNESTKSSLKCNQSSFKLTHWATRALLN